ALVDNNPPGSPAHPGPSLVQGLVRDLVEDFQGRGVRRHVDLFFPEEGPRIDHLKQWLYLIARHTAPGAVAAIRQRPAEADPLRWYRLVKQPVLLLQGGASFLGGRAMGEHLAGVIPHAKLHVFDGKGHAPFLTAAEEFNRVLGDFLRLEAPTAPRPE
ncbi:MAG: alpha/beta fold hydrolase, partial [Chloroflexota bacterium]